MSEIREPGRVNKTKGEKEKDHIERGPEKKGGDSGKPNPGFRPPKEAAAAKEARDRAEKLKKMKETDQRLSQQRIAEIREKLRTQTPEAPEYKREATQAGKLNRQQGDSGN